MAGRTLRDLVSGAQTGSHDALVGELGSMVLVGPPVDEAEKPSVFQYATAHARGAGPTPIEQLLDGVVYPLVKRAGAHLADVILLGRASSNDVAVEHASVSKLHARIAIEAGGGYRVSDAKSTNGTFVDGRQLGDGESVALRPGVELRIGDVLLRVHDTRTLVGIASRFRTSTP